MVGVRRDERTRPLRGRLWQRCQLPGIPARCQPAPGGGRPAVPTEPWNWPLSGQPGPARLDTAQETGQSRAGFGPSCSLLQIPCPYAEHVSDNQSRSGRPKAVSLQQLARLCRWLAVQAGTARIEFADNRSQLASELRLFTFRSCRLNIKQFSSLPYF